LPIVIVLNSLNNAVI